MTATGAKTAERRHVRTAVVTGGASGMGAAIAARLARAGAAVAIFDQDLDGGCRVAEELGREGHTTLALQVDVADREQVDAAVAETRSKLAPIDVLVNDAGIAAFTPFRDITEADWDRMMAVNLRGPFNCCQAALGDMIERGWGRIVNISSGGAQHGTGWMAHYVASKAGVIGLTKSLAREFGSSGITVNSIAPGGIDTPMLHREARGDGIRTDVPQAAQGAPPPIDRLGTTDEIAAACSFLVSDEAAFITGQILAVNGGWYM